MLKNFSLFIALRYLKPKRTYVSIITLISVIGVALGVTVLIVVIAVMSGFEKKLEELILGFEPHVWVKQAGSIEQWDPNNEGLHWEEVLEMVRGVADVESASPYLMGQILLQFGEKATRRQNAMMMMGVDSYDDRQVDRLRELVREGDFDLSYDTVYGAVVSAQFAEKNGVGVEGSGAALTRIDAFSTGDLEGIVGDLLDGADNEEMSDAELRAYFKKLANRIQTPIDLRVTGLFDSLGYADMMFVPLEVAQELYEYGDNVHGISVRLPDAFKADGVREAIDAVLPPGWYTETWIERHKQRFDAIRNERAMMYFVLFFIVLVAAFSTMNTMITVTVQKRHEIGVMKALGARVSQIVWVFLAQGMIVGVIGAIAGYGLGTFVLSIRNDAQAWLAERMGIHIFSEETYGIAEIPALLVGTDLAVICIGAFVLCALAALPPAYMVARLDPAKALRD